MESNLQIISGKYKSRRLIMPKDIRPTQNRARIAIFNMLEDIKKFESVMVWDAFAGSGAFGLEFLSRGWAARVLFTDNSLESIRAIRKNAANSDGKIEIVQKHAMTQIPLVAPITDIVFIDPPYENFAVSQKFVSKFIASAKAGAIIVWEIEDTNSDKAEKTLSALPIQILKDKKYGRARFLILKCN